MRCLTTNLRSSTVPVIRTAAPASAPRRPRWVSMVRKQQQVDGPPASAPTTTAKKTHESAPKLIKLKMETTIGYFQIGSGQKKTSKAIQATTPTVELTTCSASKMSTITKQVCCARISKIRRNRRSQRRRSEYSSHIWRIPIVFRPRKRRRQYSEYCNKSCSKTRICRRRDRRPRRRGSEP